MDESSFNTPLIDGGLNESMNEFKNGMMNE